MRLLIDGYNLLHATDIFGQGELAGTLEGAREALLDWLSAQLPAKLRKATSIVFDAAGAPPGLPSHFRRAQMKVCFARGFADADAMLEQIIAECPAPKQLLVVSSDHRVQRAARQRGTTYCDSDRWIRDLTTHNERRSDEVDLSGSEFSPQFWIREFTDHLGDFDVQPSELSRENTFEEMPPASDEKPTGRPQNNDFEGFARDYLDDVEKLFDDDN